jgi:exodeoxyribonuclease V alpha subunit
MSETAAAAIDRALAEFFCARSGLGQEDNNRFAKIILTLSAALRDGHLCIELKPEERDVVAGSALSSEDGSLPLVLSGSQLYLSRYYCQEKRLADRLREISRAVIDVPGCEELLEKEYPPNIEHDALQKKAVLQAITRRLAIITGGPGSGKTTTIVTIVNELLNLPGPELKVALAAPTGKAATRMRESIHAMISALKLRPDVLAGFPDEAKTLHRLLGFTGMGGKPRYHAGNPLGFDVVIVDEASMVDLPLMCRLVAALKPDSRLILLGDKDQLASVESGAVLADCIRSLPENVVELKNSYRFDSSISQFAVSINRGDSEAAWTLLGEDSVGLQRAGPEWFSGIEQKYRIFLEYVNAASGPDDYPELFQRFRDFQVLCAVRHGARGVHGINSRLEQRFSETGLSDTRAPWYPGKPVIVTKNDYNLGLYNGDIGLCLPDPARDGLLCVWFERGQRDVQSFIPTRLPACETVWAMTIHKSQGSEFNEVLIVLPDKENRVLCRELLYTAATRGRERVEILAEEEIFGLAVARKTCRSSGLAARLAADSTG